MSQKSERIGSDSFQIPVAEQALSNLQNLCRAKKYVGGVNNFFVGKQNCHNEHENIWVGYQNVQAGY